MLHPIKEEESLKEKDDRAHEMGQPNKSTKLLMSSRNFFMFSILVCYSIVSSILHGFSRYGSETPRRTTWSEEQVPLITPSHCGYREYPWPEHHSGLPYLADVFASHDAQWVYFVSLNRGACLEEWRKADVFEGEQGKGYRFICSFDDSTHIFTEFIFAPWVHNQGLVFRCRIPEKYQSLVSQPQSTTHLHVDLHAIDDPEADPKGIFRVKPFPSMDIRDTPKLAQLPVCHAIHNTTTNAVPRNLTIVTRIKSKYGQTNVETTELPYQRILNEWIEYHRQQGGDHFIITDNDDEPGPIRSILQPHIDSGLVTYLWSPLRDCIRDYGGNRGITDRRGQIAATLSALHRYGHLTEYFGHMDVDEFFVAFNNATVLDFVRTVSDTFDAVAFVPSCMAPCNGTCVSANEPILSKWRCLTGGHYADKKLILRPRRIWAFSIHYPTLNYDGDVPREYLVNDKTEGLLAHYRREENSGIVTWQSDEFEGLVRNRFTERFEYMDRFSGERPRKDCLETTVSQEDQI